MSIMSPIFPMPEPHHYSDYGFDPQIGYFQVMEEARRQPKQRPLDSVRFKLQKPISKDNERTKKRKRWWRSALSFLKRSAATGDDARPRSNSEEADLFNATYARRAVSGPLYATEPASGASTPCWAVSRSLTAAEVGEATATPYFSLRELNLGVGQQISASSAQISMPIYLVT